MEALLTDLVTADPELQTYSFNAVLEVMRSHQNGSSAHTFPLDLFHTLLDKIISSELPEVSFVLDALLVQSVREYLDLHYYCYVVLRGHRHAVRIFNILRQIRFPTKEQLVNSKCMFGDASCRKMMKFKDAFSSCWLSLLPLLPPPHFKKSLQLMTDLIIPNIIQPELLLSFFSRVHQSGGPEAILALEPLYFLMKEKNLEVPEFYDRLYDLIDGDVFKSSYRLTFMRQVGLFMSSTMIPAYVVAGIIKRLLQVALVSSPEVVVWATSLVYNLLWHHPTCRPLIHREASSDAVAGSMVYDPKTSKILESQAIDSSLWEIKSIECQVHRTVSKLPNLFSEKFSRPPFDIDSIIDELEKIDSVSVALEELTHKWSRPPPTNSEIPMDLF